MREAVLHQAVHLLERDGPAALRARAVATAAGTSTAALYELFGDKAGLVRAIFLEGFHLLRQQLDAVAVSPDPRADVVALLDASRRFAVAHPMLFEVMYSRPFPEFAPLATDRKDGVAIYRLVVGRVRRWLAEAGSDRDPVDAAQALVAANRGLVASEIAGISGSTARSVDRQWAVAIHALLDGLAGAGGR